jgi:hypothetical protein
VNSMAEFMARQEKAIQGGGEEEDE